MARQSRLPKYRHHKSTNRAVVTINGRDIYLGVYDSPESRARYDAVIAEWLAAGRAEPAPAGITPTVTKLVELYLTHARGYYVKNGEPTSQLERVQRSLAVATALYGDLRADQFGPAKLKAVRQVMIDKGWTRTHINHCVGCVKRCWKWGVAEELIPPGAFQALQAVEGLRAGRTTARPGKAGKVPPAPEWAVRLVQQLVLPQVRDMIELQLWTGARPGEIVQLRPGDVDRSGRVEIDGLPVDLPGVWVYRPGTHKTEHHDHHRIILLGPQAQAVLAPYLFRDPAAFCFSPAEGLAARYRQRREQRQSKVPPSQARRGEARASRARRRPPGGHYTRDNYTSAIADAIRRWNRRWHPPLVMIPHWHPHQLRHNSATRLVPLFGWDVARIILGHKSVEMTRVYVADDLKKAAEAVRDAG